MKSPYPANSQPTRHLGGTFCRQGIRSVRAFTLVELLLSMTILSVLMLVVVNVIGIVQQQWTRANSRVTAFREARMAFDVISRNLSQATLNTYWNSETELIGRDNANQELFKAKNYVRYSELQFVCGGTTGLLADAGGLPTVYPGHAVFFQAPLGIARLVSSTGSTVDTENMANLLCGRGYFVAWGNDSGFRPSFLDTVGTVAPRWRYRLLEYSPTAESNQIYYDPQNKNDLAARRPITDTARSRKWFQDASSSLSVKGETQSNRAFTRPVADNIIALVISPQLETSTTGTSLPEKIAPFYEYDSALVSNPGATSSSSSNPQGTQHLMPPLLKVTMVALDSAAGERLSEGGNQSMQASLANVLAPLFHNANNYNSPSSAYRNDLQTLTTFLTSQKLNYRVFTTTIVMKQARWSH